MTEPSATAPLPEADWGHPSKAVVAAVAELCAGPRALPDVACGAGKNDVGAEVSAHAAFAQGNVLILVPTIELLSHVGPGVSSPVRNEPGPARAGALSPAADR